ncbi:hypothetical protein GR138_12930 [Shinella kummerowiae]|uniref:Uncharacterized protein n=1 Tax=Shinella kummerowiae TaxID=417745 RepID=A0A6N8SAJ6_9HYPH|nr:hypothetical protein [Shinella kummerowiae]MXN46095.1 hypothetical protein [Shinella kummerowiae]
MLDRCGLAAHRECSCEPSAVPCRAHPEPIDIIEDANTGIATHGPICLAALAAIVWAITFYAATKFGTAAI